MPLLSITSLFSCGNVDEPFINEKKFVRTITIDYGMHIKNRATILLGEAIIASVVIDKYDLPIIAGDEVTIRYTGEFIEQETYPSTIVFLDGEIVSVSVDHLLMEKLEIIDKLDEGNSLRYVSSGELVTGKLLTRNCINPDETFNDLDSYRVGAYIYAVIKDGDCLAFYSYDPYETI